MSDLIARYIRTCEGDPNGVTFPFAYANDFNLWFYRGGGHAMGQATVAYRSEGRGGCLPPSGGAVRAERRDGSGFGVEHRASTAPSQAPYGAV
jgi:hypothetical protein